MNVNNQINTGLEGLGKLYKGGVHAYYVSKKGQVNKRSFLGMIFSWLNLKIKGKDYTAKRLQTMTKNVFEAMEKCENYDINTLNNRVEKFVQEDIGRAVQIIKNQNFDSEGISGSNIATVVASKLDVYARQEISKKIRVELETPPKELLKDGTNVAKNELFNKDICRLINLAKYIQKEGINEVNDSFQKDYLLSLNLSEENIEKWKQVLVGWKYSISNQDKKNSFEDKFADFLTNLLNDNWVEIKTKSKGVTETIPEGGNKIDKQFTKKNTKMISLTIQEPSQPPKTMKVPESTLADLSRATYTVEGKILSRDSKQKQQEYQKMNLQIIKEGENLVRTGEDQMLIYQLHSEIEDFIKNNLPTASKSEKQIYLARILKWGNQTAMGNTFEGLRKYINPISYSINDKTYTIGPSQDQSLYLEPLKDKELPKYKIFYDKEDKDIKMEFICNQKLIYQGQYYYFIQAKTIVSVTDSEKEGEFTLSPLKPFQGGENFPNIPPI